MEFSEGRLRLAIDSEAFVSFAKPFELTENRMLELLVEMVGYTVARLALPLLSFGKVRVAPLASPARKFNLIGCRRDERGRIEVDSIAAEFIGVVLCLIGAFGIAFVILGRI